MFRVMLCYLEISFSIQKQTVYTNTNRVQLTYWFLILNLAGIIFFFQTTRDYGWKPNADPSEILRTKMLKRSGPQRTEKFHNYITVL